MEKDGVGAIGEEQTSSEQRLSKRTSTVEDSGTFPFILLRTPCHFYAARPPHVVEVDFRCALAPPALRMIWYGTGSPSGTSRAVPPLFRAVQW